MGPDHHRVFLYTPDLSVSNQKDSPQRQTAILSDVTDFLRTWYPLDFLKAPQAQQDVGVNRKAIQTQGTCRAWGNLFARGFARVILDRVRGKLDPAPGSRNRGSELDADAKFNFFYPPLVGESRS
jgi:hypothetical protein